MNPLRAACTATRSGLMALFLALLVVWFMAVPRAQGRSRGAAIENVTVVDVETGNRLTNQTVLVNGTMISNVGSAATVKIPPSARRLDGRRKFLIPGLWQMHGHDVRQ